MKGIGFGRAYREDERDVFLIQHMLGREIGKCYLGNTYGYVCLESNDEKISIIRSMLDKEWRASCGSIENGRLKTEKGIFSLESFGEYYDSYDDGKAELLGVYLNGKLMGTVRKSLFSVGAMYFIVVGDSLDESLLKYVFVLLSMEYMGAEITGGFIRRILNRVLRYKDRKVTFDTIREYNTFLKGVLA